MQVYVYIKKETGEVQTFGSVKSLSETLQIKPDKLYTCFTRKKQQEYSNKEYRIIKTVLTRTQTNCDEN